MTGSREEMLDGARLLSRIKIQHRLVYQVLEKERFVKVLGAVGCLRS